MSARSRRGATAVAVTTIAIATGAGTGGCATRSDEPTGRLQSAGVTVTVELRSTPDHEREVRATFSPDRAGFHVYSMDLPPQGVDGLGRPTVVAVRGDLRSRGKPTANQSVRILRPAGLGVDLPVYPDGPVTITLPVRQTGSRRADVVVSYAACSEQQCLPPVTGQAIPLDLG